ncbi:allantoin permease [Acinetobacter qingfengensis]|uniref:Allantoin permease n=1 Tax=Acinetobacter qingfengensis TaxID=1262585 RepID=A0A1E7R375_9GAMM|nr:allantoin permease [Acinetobacter qingfengensis]KAA8730857.1 allantoin permease [Acinetobacter qingfengensis]OEY93775.1 allantoin permease [Acinetobacter qingfengensis]
MRVTEHPTESVTDSDSQKAVNETLEDYTLRYAPHSFRRWSPKVVAITALGGIAYLADFSIGASIGMSYGTTNAIFSILFAAIIIFLTGIPLAYYAARYNIDLDLITRGAGFGYVGSVVTSIIFASFTFIFFALEGSIMAQGLLLGLNIPLWAGYLISTLMVIPLVIYGMKALSKLQVWTTPIWLILMIGPVAYLIYQEPDLVRQFTTFNGHEGYASVDMAAIMLGAGVCLSLIMQIGEQIDYLRFMPARTKENSKSWWVAVISAGPGWVILGAIKQIIGAFLGFYLLTKLPGVNSTEPVQQFNAAFHDMLPGWLALTLAVILVVISQIKINVTNAYSGSLAWTSAYTRISKYYPGRIIFVMVNLAIALALMEGNMFAVLGKILGFYSNFAIAWVVVVATDIAINKYVLKLSPKEPEYRRDMLYNINPVGMVSFLAAAGLSIAAFFGILGDFLSSYSPLIALIVAFVLTPVMGLLTQGKYYIKQKDDGVAEPRYNSEGTPVSTIYQCVVCEQDYERPDIMFSHKHHGIICSLCKTLDK